MILVHDAAKGLETAADERLVSLMNQDFDPVEDGLVSNGLCIVGGTHESDLFCRFAGRAAVRDDQGQGTAKLHHPPLGRLAKPEHAAERGNSVVDTGRCPVKTALALESGRRCLLGSDVAPECPSSRARDGDAQRRGAAEARRRPGAGE
jgi:hypothetical protein